jgi:hypothetical protein
MRDAGIHYPAQGISVLSMTGVVTLIYSFKKSKEQYESIYRII